MINLFQKLQNCHCDIVRSIVFIVSVVHCAPAPPPRRRPAPCPGLSSGRTMRAVVCTYLLSIILNLHSIVLVLRSLRLVQEYHYLLLYLPFYIPPMVCYARVARTIRDHPTLSLTKSSFRSRGCTLVRQKEGQRCARRPTESQNALFMNRLITCGKVIVSVSGSDYPRDRY